MSRLQTNRPRQAVVLFLVLCAVVTMKQSIYTGNSRDGAPDSGDNVMKSAKQQNRQGDARKETEECLASAPGCHCPERPVAQARSDEAWATHHERMVQDVMTFSKLDVVFLGDSITELWNGTKSLGRKQLKGGREAFNKFFTRQGGSNMDAIPLGASSDRTNNLLWHLQNGVLPDTLRPKVWVVLIGTNDIGILNCSSDRTFPRIVGVVQYLKAQRPESKVVLRGLLPRSDHKTTSKLGEKNEAVVRVNQQLQAYADQDPTVSYLDVANVFLRDDEENGGQEINTDRMPDSLHPNVDGLLAWAPFIAKELNKLLR